MPRGVYKRKPFTKKHRQKMRRAKMRNKHLRWKGGQFAGEDGYIYILCQNHPRANKWGYVRRAILVMEKRLGRYINLPEIIHHKGIKYPISSLENRQDDRPENLQLFSNRSKHMKFHHMLNKRKGELRWSY